MRFLREPQPIKIFEFNLTPEEREKVRRKKREANEPTVFNKLKKIEKRAKLKSIQKEFEIPNDEIKTNKKLKTY